MRLMSSTWRMIVSVHWSKTSLPFDDMPAIAALQPFGRELDRRQRVLDFMGDAARDVGPGGAALRGDEVGDVVERDDAALVGAERIAGHAHVEQALAAVARQCRLALMQPGTHRARLGQNLAELGQHVLDATPDQRAAGGIGTKQPLGGGVADRNDAAFIDADDARRHARQGRLDEGAPFVVERVGGGQGLCCRRNSPVILLKVSPRWPRSPSDLRVGTCT